MILIVLGYLLLLVNFNNNLDIVLNGIAYALMITGLATKISFSNKFLGAAKAYFAALILMILEALAYYYIKDEGIILIIMLLISIVVVLINVVGMRDINLGLKEVEENYNLDFKTKTLDALVKAYLVTKMIFFFVVAIAGIGFKLNLDSFTIFLNYLSTGLVLIYLIMLVLTVPDFHRLMKKAK